MPARIAMRSAYRCATPRQNPERLALSLPLRLCTSGKVWMPLIKEWWSHHAKIQISVS